jgi:hypothetical protein
MNVLDLTCSIMHLAVIECPVSKKCSRISLQYLNENDIVFLPHFVGVDNIAVTQWLIHVLPDHRMYCTYSCFCCFYQSSFKYIREAPISGGHAETYLVEALCYKVEGCGFAS